MPPLRSTPRLRIHLLGDTALLAELGTRLDTALNTRAIALATALKKRRDVRQAVAGYASVTVHFDPDLITQEALGAAIKRLAEIAWQVNEKMENIGARRLYTVMEKLLEGVSFDAAKHSGETITVDAGYVDSRLKGLAQSEDLARYVL